MMERNRLTIREGDEVYGADGDKVGSVIAVEPGYIVAEKGWFFPTDYYIPTSAIASYDDGRVNLNVTKDAALDQGWDTVPVVTTEAELAETRAAAFATDADTTVTADELRVPVYEEELTATKRPREAGGVRIEKDVVAEEQALDVPVTEERLRVVRRTVDRPVDATEADAAFEETIVDVPVRTEDVEVAKRVRVGEEIEIGKEAVQRTEHVRGTVRREEVTVTEAEPGAVVEEAEPPH